MARRKKKTSHTPRIKRMNRKSRLQSASDSWLKTYCGGCLIRGYRKRFGVSATTAVLELRMLGVSLDDLLVKKALEGEQASIQAKQARREKRLQRLRELSQDEEDVWLNGCHDLDCAWISSLQKGCPNDMPRKQQRLKPTIAHSDKLAILRAADDIIACGGRTLLSKILKGSKERKLLELELNLNPSYGYFKHLALDEIIGKIDGMIHAGYLRTELSGKLPMIVFTPLGWVIERERRAEEFLRMWDALLISGIMPPDLNDLKDRNRGMMFLFLYKILLSRNTRYIPLLELWSSCDYRKVQAEIRQVIEGLKQGADMDDIEWRLLLIDRAKRLLIPTAEPVFVWCDRCGRPFVMDDTNPEYYTAAGLAVPDTCPDHR